MFMHHVFVRSLVAAAALLVAGTASAGTGISGQGTWETTLLARDLDSDGKVDAYYDTVLDISWLADADVIGSVSFAVATEWASNLNVAGITGWHLPTINIESCQTANDGTFLNGGGVCGYGVHSWTSDMAHMNLVTLGNESYSGYTYDPETDTTVGDGIPTGEDLLSNAGPFIDLQAAGYWFSKDYAYWGTSYEADSAWRYSFHAGRQDSLSDQANLNAWAVHDGDVGLLVAVPEPETYAMLLAGLGAVGLMARRRRKTD